MKSRKSFFSVLLFLSASLALAASLTRSQTPSIPSAAQQAPGHNPPDDNVPSPPTVDKKILEGNDKDMKKKVEQLYQLASELKSEVEKTDSSKVLSLSLVKKAEEIEKLARDIKNRSKG